MSRVFRFLLPNKISSQIALIVVGSLIGLHVILTAIFLLRSLDQHQDRSLSHPGQIEMLVTLLDAAAPEDRNRLAEVISAQYPDIALKLDQSEAFDWTTQSATQDLHWFGRRLGSEFHVVFDQRAGSASGEPRYVHVRLRDGTVVTTKILQPPGWRVFDPIVMTVFLMAVLIVLLGLWAAQAVTAPLRSFAKAAESFSPEDVITPLPERGPIEVRAAARALNQLRERVKTLLDDRTHMLVAVGHDLRTPITRLRLSSEFVCDQKLRDQILRDLDQMRAMVESILVFLREGRSSKNAVSVDIAATVQTVCDEFVDTGHDVHLGATADVAVMAQPDELRRAITNVVDNAVRYAGAATVSAVSTETGVAVVVEDDGPGIPDERKMAMLQPFIRGEPARSMDDASGFGLGLSIAKAIVTALGGTLTLHDGKPHGLAVRIELPAAAEQPVRRNN
ncbi:MAG: ATP-binding protein [Burkholderiales bacterium]